MSVTLELSDLTPFVPNLSEEKAELMIEDALAMAARVAPCLFGDDELPEADQKYAKAILRGAILRWADQGTGEGPQLTAGVFAMTPTRTPRRNLLLPTEIRQLSVICGGTSTRRAYTVDMIPVEDEEEQP